MTDKRGGNNIDNLKSFKDLTTERQREIAKQGGIKSQEVKAKKKIERTLLTNLLAGKFNGVLSEDVKALIDKAEVNIEDVMHLRQIEKAIKKADTRAYEVVLDRAFGKVKQTFIQENINDELSEFDEELVRDGLERIKKKASEEYKRGLNDKK